MIVRYREDPVAGGVMIAALALLIGTLLFIVLAPRPPMPSAADKIEAQNKITLETDAANKALAESNAYNASKLWVGDEQKVGPDVFAAVNAVAKAHGLSLERLQPQRLNDKTVPSQLPYLAIVSGGYAGVAGFVKDLETPGTKLVVSSVMVSSSDSASDKVTGSVGIVAYLAPSVPVPIVQPKETTRA
jgi:hypothetical protein